PGVREAAVLSPPFPDDAPAPPTAGASCSFRSSVCGRVPTRARASHPELPRRSFHVNHVRRGRSPAWAIARSGGGAGRGDGGGAARARIAAARDRTWDRESPGRDSCVVYRAPFSPSSLDPLGAMRVRLLFFALYRDLLGTAETTAELPAGSTVATLVEWLRARDNGFDRLP